MSTETLYAPSFCAVSPEVCKGGRKNATDVLWADNGARSSTFSVLPSIARLIDLRIALFTRRRA